METTEITSANITQIVEGHDIVLIDFWAPWCGPCRAFKPIFEKAAAAHTDLTFGTCNTEEQGKLASELGIRSIPTLMVFREGVLLYAQPGMLPAEALEDLIRQVRALNMAEVHAKVAEQQQKVANS